MKTKNLFWAVALLLLTASCTKVRNGNVAIKVNLLGDNKGEMEVLGAGRYWVGVNEELYIFPTFLQNKVWTDDINEDSRSQEGFDFQSNEGLQLNADVGISYRIKKEDVPTIFTSYRKGVSEITNVNLRNIVRDAFTLNSSKYTAQYIYGDGRAQFMEEINIIVKQEAGKNGITVEKVYLVGGITPPESVKKSLDDKMRAKQQAQQRENEVATARAQFKIDSIKSKAEAYKIITRAEAEAKANQIKARSITPNLINYEKVKKWNGELPKVSGETRPLIDISQTLN
ncbi:SPFH domain-containing protein [Sediminitomix flava]|uniref:Regulator of protease activity HflC (Stomatin/prohibitin superfamily) n=1 Tax=Sediminitomix flava TaxID=379075 RepID=A0A315ZUI8_SEDFL|nr:SPFH domain-containing protein [Sediminitomix flava]PWJ39309.1 regulator of protease activity HflC (stomatin/prohibitin superfamily) [Sediminitomix flava]